MDEYVSKLMLEPFDVEDGSLKNVTPEYAFALGVEWHLFRQQLLESRPFRVLCLPENRSRFVKLAERHRRFVEDRPTGSADWVEIWVGDVIAPEPPGSRPT